MKKKILIISVGRSDYDRYLPILSALHKSKKTKLSLFLASAHYNKKLGHTANYVDKKFNIIKGNIPRSRKSSEKGNDGKTMNLGDVGNANIATFGIAPWKMETAKAMAILGMNF